jgi:hypothetical protein
MLLEEGLRSLGKRQRLCCSELALRFLGALLEERVNAVLELLAQSSSPLTRLG